MKEYTKIINEDTKEVSVFLGTDIDWAVSDGFSEMEVEQAYNGSWYLQGYAPKKPEMTYDEVVEERVLYRQQNIDDKTLERLRKQANGTWTEEDERAYLELDEKVTKYIEENYPYPKA
jgi:hypothetical protein